MRPSLLCVAAVAAVAVVPISAEAANSTVAVGNANGTTTALVTPERQLQSTIVSPAAVIHAEAEVDGATGCGPIYTPPRGKAIVITQVTYDLASGQEGTEDFAGLHESGVCSDHNFDLGDTIHKDEAQSHTFPTGLPMADVYAFVGSAGYAIVLITGYLIPASQLPAQVQQPVVRPLKGMAGWRQ